MVSLQILSLLMVTSTVLSSTPQFNTNLFPNFTTNYTSGCDLSQARMTLPTNQTALVEPSISPSFIGLGVGVQNYTCSNTTYSLTGAVAELFDISCLYGSQAFSSLPDTAYSFWQAAPSDLTIQSVISYLAASPLNNHSILGQHYYVTTPGNASTVSPKWDFTSAGTTNGDASAFVIGAKVGDIAGPFGNQTDVDWLSVKEVEGSLASQVFRINTIGGQAPSSCQQGSGPISLKYSAQYWFFGGSIKNGTTVSATSASGTAAKTTASSTVKKNSGFSTVASLRAGSLPPWISAHTALACLVPISIMVHVF